MRQILYTLLILATIFSCRKKEISTEIGAYAECDTFTKLSESATISKLIGTWIWVRRSCYWNPKVVPADKNAVVTFNADKSFSVVEDGITLTQGTWKLKTDSRVWELDLSKENRYLYGYITFCNTNEVSFDNTATDACKFTFVKK